MGEISFNYKINIKPVNVFAFKYWYEKSIENSFAYQRYIAFSDASIFNNPVAITKVATGLSQLYDLFIDKQTHPVAYFNLMHRFEEIQYNTNINTLNKLDKNNKGVVRNKHIFAESHRLSFDIYKDISSLNRYDLEMYILLKESWLSIDDSLQIYKDLSVEQDHRNKMKIYADMYKTNRTNNFNIYKEYYVKPYLDNKIYINKTFSINERYDNICNKFKDIILSQPDKIAYNEQSMLLTFSDVLHGNINKQIHTQYALDRIAEHNKDFFAQKNDKYTRLNNYNEINANNSDKQSFVQLPTFLYNKHKNSILFNQVLLSNTARNTKKQQMLHQANKTLNKAFYRQIYGIRVYEKPTYVLDIDTFAIQEKKHGFIIHNQITADMKSKNSVITDNLHIHKQNVNTFIDETRWLDDTESDSIISGNIFTSKNNKILKSDVSLGVYKYNTKTTFNPSVFIEKQCLDLSYIDINNMISINKNNKKIYTIRSQYFVDNHSKSISLFKDIFKYKDNKNIRLYDNINLYKDSIAINDKASELWINDNSYRFTIFEQQMIDKDSQMISIYNKMQGFVKDRTIIEIATDIESVIKYHIPTNYINILHNDFDKIIIPMSKIYKQSYIDIIERKVKKVSSKGFLTFDLTASVVPVNAYIQSLNLFCDKITHESFLDYKNTHITKSKVHSAIFKDELAYKEHYYGNLINNQYWISKKESYMFKDNNLFGSKKSYNAFADNNDIHMLLNQKDIIYGYKSLFVDKISEICYYDYGITWMDKTLDASINSQLHIAQQQKHTQVIDCVSSFIKKEMSAFYTYGVFSSSMIDKTSLFSELKTIQKTNKECGLQLEDFGNWAWVYETPNPFDGINYSIDELLLPENDTRYERFEDIIFNKETMMPRNPVKQIDENTFIAKYPIRHPLPKYKDVAIDYDKSAVNFENYYGIETRIMQTVFLKFYRIWQNKIFEFGTMSMTQSVKLILEYLYSWIVEYFSLDEIEQALRVFKLIRWYGESSIIQNSQYIIKYEYDILESKLNTGTCLIPNNLGEENETMLVDSKLGVIKNNPMLIGISNAYVEFYINNKKNTTFTFSLSNTVGSVNIYINEILIDIVSRSALNLTYELPYTGDINTIRIEKEMSHNLNSTFYIGNIKIPNGTFKELSIEFDPVLKAGNKPLNDIAKKMIAIANLYDNKDEIYDIIKKGNLGVSELYKKITEYWELHHQNKTKGKRLTIKEI